MTTTELVAQWREPSPHRTTNFTPGFWGLVIELGASPAETLARFMIHHDNDLERIEDTCQAIDDVIAGRYRAGWFTGDNDCGVAYGNGYVFIASDYHDWDQILITAEQFRAAFHWLRDLRTSSDFTNPDATIEPLKVSVVSHGPGSGEHYRELGGSFFIESSPNTDHLN